MEIEVWKPIEGYEGIYEVSSFGRVRSLDRVVDFGNENYSRRMLCKGKIMKGSISRNGYIYILHNIKKRVPKSWLQQELRDSYLVGLRLERRTTLSSQSATLTMQR